MRTLQWMLGPVFLFFLLQGCAAVKTEPIAENPARVEGEILPIVLGAVYSLTGGMAGLDVPSLQGAQLAVGQANSGGGGLGRPVQLVVMDGASNPGTAAERSARLLEEYPEVSALLGLSDTDLVLAAVPAVSAAGRLFLTSGATSPKLPDLFPGFLFLACFGDNFQAAAGAEWAFNDLGARTVSVLFNSESTYSRLLQGYFRTRFEELGGRVVSVAGYSSGSGLRGPVSSLKQAEFIYLAATPDEVLQAVQTLRRAGHAGPILGGDGFDVAGLWPAHPEVKQIFFTTHAFLGVYNSDPQVVAFRQAFSRAFPGVVPDAFAALGYDTVRLLLAAVHEAGSADPEAVRNALAGIHDFSGVTGRIGYAVGSGVPVKSVTILGADRGEIRLVRQLLPDRAPPP